MGRTILEDRPGTAVSRLSNQEPDAGFAIVVVIVVVVVGGKTKGKHKRPIRRIDLFRLLHKLNGAVT